VEPNRVRIPIVKNETRICKKKNLLVVEYLMEEGIILLAAMEQERHNFAKALGKEDVCRGAQNCTDGTYGGTYGTRWRGTRIWNITNDEWNGSKATSSGGAICCTSVLSLCWGTIMC
jgi:predicted outer membrane repeat protein